MYNSRLVVTWKKCINVKDPWYFPVIFTPIMCCSWCWSFVEGNKCGWSLWQWSKEEWECYKAQSWLISRTCYEKPLSHNIIVIILCQENHNPGKKDLTAEISCLSSCISLLKNSTFWSCGKFGVSSSHSPAVEAWSTFGVQHHCCLIICHIHISHTCFSKTETTSC